MATKQEAADILAKLVEKAQSGEVITIHDLAVTGAIGIASVHKDEQEKKKKRETRLVRYTTQQAEYEYTGYDSPKLWRDARIERHEFVGETSRNYIKADGSKIDKQERRFRRSPYFETYEAAREHLIAGIKGEIERAQRSIDQAAEEMETAKRRVASTAALPEHEPETQS